MKIFFPPSGKTKQYDTYYISENGRDMSMCGKTADSACKSLEYVLGIYYKKNQVPKPGLSLITSKSLTINRQLTVGKNSFFTKEKRRRIKKNPINIM